MTAHTITSGLISALLFASTGNLSTAATYYVDINNSTPSAPFTSWGTAATNIQDAIGQTVSSDTVLVTNGTYNITSTITVTNDIEIWSVNGPSNTIIDANDNCRVVNLGSNDCVISGFTVTRGNISGNGGGIFCATDEPSVTNCIVTLNKAYNGGGMFHGRAYESTFSHNRVESPSYSGASFGGGQRYGSAYDCVFDNNEATRGGGLSDAGAYSCKVINNTAQFKAGTSGGLIKLYFGAGGGMLLGSAYNCDISGNWVGGGEGGGVCGVVATNCNITENQATAWSFTDHIPTGIGGGAYGGRLTGCAILENSAEKSGGGVYKGRAVDCTISSNSATNYGGGVYEGTANQCVISNNLAFQGGGIYMGTADGCLIVSNTAEHGGGSCISSLQDCNISANQADFGGGAYEGSVSNCIIMGNSATGSGGGTYYGTSYDSIIISNSATYGGGSYEGQVSNCILSDNSATAYGGGIAWLTAYNSVVSSNWAGTAGGGVIDCIAFNCLIVENEAGEGGGMMWSGEINYPCAVYNCTISANNASTRGGGAAGGQIINSIVQYNSAPIGPDFDSASCSNSCSPDLAHGVNGNITNAPSFVDAASGNYRLAADSPCIDAGDNSYVSTPSDLDEQPRIVGGLVDMGAYESGFPGCSVTNCNVTASETMLQWTAYPMWNTSVFWSTNLATMPFTNLVSDIPYPVNSFTDFVHCVHDQCFYQVEITP